MTLLGPIFTADLGVTLVPGEPASTGTLLKLIGGGSTKSGTRVTEQKALGMPAVWRAVTLIAGTIASLPLHPYLRSEAGRQLVKTGQAVELLDEPHPDMTPFEFWEVVYAHQLLWGNAYLYKVYDNAGRVRELWPLPPDSVQVGRTSNFGTKVYAVTFSGLNAGRTTVLDDDTILHIPAFGYDGICGVSPIRMAREGIGLALAAEEYGARLYGNGSLATGVLQTEQRLTSKQADALHARWIEKRTGLGSAHDTIVLDKGATFTQLSINPEDAQFIESRGFQISEIARIFGVPPHMLMATDKSTSWGTGIEQQTIGFVVYTLRPWLTRNEQRIARVLWPKPTYARYSLEGLLRGDSAQRAAFYKAMFEMGAFNPNKILELEDQPGYDGGDVRYRPMNLAPIGAGATTDGTHPVGELSDAEVARAVTEMVQKVYLGVGKVLSEAEARDLLNRAGAGLGTNFQPAETPPAGPTDAPQEDDDA